MVDDDLFRNVTLQICSSLDMATGVRRCIPLIAEVVPLDGVSIHLYEETLGSMRTILIADRETVRELDILTPLSPEARRKMAERNPMDRLMVTRPGLEPVAVHIINHPEHDRVVREFLSHFGGSVDSSLLMLDLQRGPKLLGYLVLTAHGQGRYTYEHARLLALLHDVFAIGFTNAITHREVLKLKDMLADENRDLNRELHRLTGKEPVGAASGLKGVMEMVRHVAPLDSPVLLRGETGVGKDVIANAIHYSSPRREGPFVKVNCGAIPETLLDSELFGHEKGAFTGAIGQKRGCFERAHQGTIYLDEIGELPLPAQVRMLRVLQYREIQRVGGTASVPVDIRIISATHRNLEEMVKAGQFREDLWFRLNVFPVMVPPLRSRKEDIPALTEYFIRKKSKELRVPTVRSLAPGTIDRLMAYGWPGNVRELENVVERALIIGGTDFLTVDRFLPLDRESDTHVGPGGQVVRLDSVISRHVRDVLDQAGGKVHGKGGAAELLGINPSTLRSMMNRLNVAYGRRRMRESTTGPER